MSHWTARTTLHLLGDIVSQISTDTLSHGIPEVNYDGESDSWHLTVELRLTDELDIEEYKKLLAEHTGDAGLSMELIDWDIVPFEQPQFFTATYLDPEWES